MSARDGVDHHLVDAELAGELRVGPETVWLHEVAGPNLAGHPLVQTLWSLLHAYALALVLRFRLLRPMENAFRHRRRVAAVVPEADGVVSIIINGRHLDELGAQPGQFFRWRFLTPQLFRTAHRSSWSSGYQRWSRWLKRLTAALSTPSVGGPYRGTVRWTRWLAGAALLLVAAVGLYAVAQQVGRRGADDVAVALGAASVQRLGAGATSQSVVGTEGRELTSAAEAVRRSLRRRPSRARL